MSDPLADLVRAYRAAGSEVGPEDVADALWLARWLPAAPPVPPVEPVRREGLDRPPDPPDLRNDPPRDRPPDRDLPPKAPAGAGAGDAVGLSLPPAEGKGGDVAGRTFWAPAAPALARPRELARSLRPLVKRVASRVRFELDEGETIRRSAEARACDPAVRPARERWLALALVLDTGTGADLWHDTAAEFAAVLATLGAFRDVRAWRLDTDGGAKLFPGRAPVPGEAPRHPRELIDPAGRTLVVVVSPCVSPAWRDGSAAQVLNLWAARGPTLLVPLLPEYMWGRTALGKARLVRVAAPAPGAAGAQLRVAVPGAWPDDAAVRGVPVPVAVLEPASLGRWVGFVSGRAATDAPALILDDAPRPIATATKVVDPPDGAARVRRFWRTSSPLARRLAGLLAAAPVVSLPILRLIRQSMLPAAGQPHEAEVLFGGLLTRLAGGPDVRFGFVPGAREALLDAAPTDESLAVLAAVSDYLGEHLTNGKTFRSVFADPSAAGAVSADAGPFAQVAAEVLARAGGDYARMVRRPPLPGRGESGPAVTESSQAPVRRERKPPEPETVTPADGVRVTPAPAAVGTARNAAALVIGISRYANPNAPPIPTAAADARALAAVLTDPAVCGFPPDRVRLLTDEQATAAAMSDSVNRWLPTAARGADVVLVALFGYSVGDTVVTEDQIAGLFVAHDHSGYLSFESLRERLGKLDARNVVLCLDCWHEGRGAYWVAPARWAPRVGQGDQGWTVLVACDFNEQWSRVNDRLRRGLFAHHIVQGLRGLGDRDGDGLVGGIELCEYVRDAVNRDARALGAQQTPCFAFGGTGGGAYLSKPRDEFDQSDEARTPYPTPVPVPAPDPGANPTPTGVEPAAGGEASEPLPRAFGRYELVERLGEGGMGVVYRARPRDGGPDVALKTPRARYADNAEIRERFDRERRALAGCRHDGIVPLLESGDVDGVAYFTMPVVEGRALGEPSVGPAEAARLVAAVADAMAHAHGRGVVHRNLKPANVVVRPDGRPLVLDFGLALVVGWDTGRALAPDEAARIPAFNRDWWPTSDFLDARLTRPGTAMGTPAYMPPEQWAGDLPAVGPRSDVYALGVVLYKLLTGRLPFLGDVQTLQQQITSPDPPPAPAELVPGLDRRLSDVALRALAKDPAARYASMAAFAAAVRAAAAGVSPDAPPPSPVEPAARTPTPPPEADSRTAVAQPGEAAGEGLPTRIGRYEVRRLLRDTGFLTVYLAFDPELQREVAVKVPRVSLSFAERDAFARAARAAVGLDHPNVCPVYEVGTDGWQPYVVARYVAGGTLAVRLLGSAALRIALEVARGVAAAHARGLVHGDLRPDHILLDAQTGGVLVTDFGLSALLVRDGDDMARSVLGSPEYLSPEMCRGAAAGPAADVYSLGAILYELLTGRPPFVGDAVAVIRAHVSERPAPPSARRPGLGPATDELCRKALAKDPADRFPSMAAFADAIDATAEPLFGLAAPADPFARLPCDFGRYRLLALQQVSWGRVQVFDARDAGDRPVTVTVLRAGADADARRVFDDEVRILRRLSDLGRSDLGRLLDAGTINGHAYHATEAVPGRPIDRYWADHRDRHGLGGLVALVAKAARAVAAAHRAFAPGVLVHRNLSPRNIEVAHGDGSDPRVVVLGFGLALVRFPDGTSDLGYTGGPVGAFGYMPLEQMAAGVDGLSPASDVYSLGVVLYQLLTGGLPYTGADSAELLEAMRTTHYAPPSRLNRGSVLFDPICRKALAQNPADRYASMDEFAQDLTALVVSGVFDRPADSPGSDAGAARRGFEREDVGDVAVVRLTDRAVLDEQRIQHLGEELVGLVEPGGCRNLVVGFARVEFLSSMMLGKLLTLHRRAEAAGGRLVLCGLRPEVQENFQVTKLDRVLTIVADEAAALRLFVPDPPRYTRVEDRGGVAVVTFRQRWSLQVAEGDEQFRDELLELAARHRRLVLNLTGVDFLSGEARAALFDLRRAVVEAGGRLVLCALPPDLLDVMRMVQADVMFTVVGTEEEALRLFGPSPGS